MLETLKECVCRANLELASRGLAALTWGNASGIDRRRGLAAIKPSGVPYEELTPERIVILDLAGTTVEGKERPSSDAPTHLALYRGFRGIGGIVHTHSRCAVMFAQARREIPCLGTTHADHFHGAVPLARPLTPAEVEADYEANTGEAIVERFAGMDPAAVPAVLVPGHGPFVWGGDVFEAVRNAAALEAVAEMALGTWLLNPNAAVLEPYLLEKHFLRKHGPGAYYGQG